MKKIILLGAVSFLSVSLFAQSFGVRAGVNISNVKIKSQGFSVMPTANAGINAGIFVNFPIALNVSIQPELAYSGMGFKVSSSGIDSTESTGYIVLPLLVRVKIPTTGLSFFAGPQYGVLISAKDKTGGESTDVKDAYKTGDFSAIAGLEYSLKFGLFLSARYQAGLSNVSKGDFEDVTEKNSSVTILLGFKF